MKTVGTEFRIFFRKGVILGVWRTPAVRMLEPWPLGLRRI